MSSVIPADAYDDFIRRLGTTAIWVPGRPVAQGSMKTFGNGAVTHSNPDLVPWRDAIGWQLKDKIKGAPYEGPMEVEASFYFHPTKRNETQHGNPMSSGQDLDKLVRAVFDAMTGIVWVDDKQAAGVIASKWWDKDFEGLNLLVRSI